MTIPRMFPLLLSLFLLPTPSLSWEHFSTTTTSNPWESNKATLKERYINYYVTKDRIPYSRQPTHFPPSPSHLFTTPKIDRWWWSNTPAWNGNEHTDLFGKFPSTRPVPYISRSPPYGRQTHFYTPNIDKRATIPPGYTDWSTGNIPSGKYNTPQVLFNGRQRYPTTTIRPFAPNLFQTPNVPKKTPWQWPSTSSYPLYTNPMFQINDYYTLARMIQDYPDLFKPPRLHNRRMHPAQWKWNGNPGKPAAASLLHVKAAPQQ